MRTAASDELLTLPSRTILEGAPEILRRAFGIEYHLCPAAPFEPANSFPAALLGALAGYHYLVINLQVEPENITLSRHSLMRYLAVSDLPGLCLSRGTVLLAPTADWSCSHDGDTDSGTLDPIRTFRGRLAKDIGEERVEYHEATHDFLTATWHEPEWSKATKK
ncbi:hypothetical protein OE88DRAFT_1733304 [Heliocybe sulcata]|uniref:Uncharacterized protein n=1 Tax=Heliocybe sulcata TaxID=5364 RepID=A0A5C3N8E0_9AGAM|nr:hypothetical protein OE88DRAFT_1733304 [Heliocybe sulcata]